MTSSALKMQAMLEDLLSKHHDISNTGEGDPAKDS